MAKNPWETLFSNGEYPSRERLLSGLTEEQINQIPDGMSHSIYEEFWHLTLWQDTITTNDNNLDKSWDEGIRFPENRIATMEEWDATVLKFNEGLKRIFEYVKVPSNLEQEIEPGFTIYDSLSCLAVHNGFHFGKILAIRQAIGAWPPEEMMK